MSDRLPNALKRLASSWAGQLTKLVKANAPIHLREYVHSKVDEKDGTSFIVRVYVNTKENPLERYGSADARAQEYGSGLRARRGSKQKYPIHAKNSSSGYLVFMGTNDFVGKLIVKDKVDHPGIQAANAGKGYIAPAKTEIRARIKEQLGPEVREAIMGDVRQSFSRSK